MTNQDQDQASRRAGNQPGNDADPNGGTGRAPPTDVRQSTDAGRQAQGRQRPQDDDPPPKERHSSEPAKGDSDCGCG